MGFLNKVGEFFKDMLDSAMLSQAYPSLQDAVNFYQTQGYQIAQLGMFSAQLWRSGTFSMKTINLVVRDDGSVDATESGLLGGERTFPRRAGAPSPSDFQRTMEQPNANGDSRAGDSFREQSSRQDTARRSIKDVDSWEMTIEKAYEILGVSPSDGRNAVTSAFHKQVAQYHPDKYAKCPEDLRKFAEARTMQIIDAYRIITESHMSL